MVLNEMQIGLDLIIGAGSGLLGAMGAYYKLKARLDLADAKNEDATKTE